MWSQFFIDVLRQLGAAQTARIGIVGLNSSLREVEGTISVGEFIALQKAFPLATFECATDILYAVRKRKSAEEIAFVEKAQSCADAIADAFRASVRPGVREHDVYANMFAAHIKAGGEVPSMILFSTEKRFWQTQLLPTFRSLERDDVLMVEAEPKVFGYMAQAVISASLRPLSNQERSMFDTSLECFDELLSAMRPGRSYKDLIETWKVRAKRRGFSAGRTMGHGLGLGQDGPLTTPSGDAGGMMVEEGDVLVLKPWISDIDDTVAVRVGATVVVGENTARRLGHYKLAPLVVA
jgi:Xaa-Pro aminopeptidase